MIEHGVEVPKIIGKIIGVARLALGQPETAPVGGDHVPVALQGVGNELKGGAHIHPAVHHENDGRAFAAPVQNVGTQAAHGDEFGSGRFHDGTKIKERSFELYRAVEFCRAAPDGLLGFGGRKMAGITLDII